MTHIDNIELIDISNDDQRRSRWAVLVPEGNSRPRHLGQINKIAAPLVPDRCHESLTSPRCNALFLTCKGHWATTLEGAAELLANTEAPSEFIATGALLDLFVLPTPPEESQLHYWGDYRVFQISDGFWEAEEVALESAPSAS